MLKAISNDIDNLKDYLSRRWEAFIAENTDIAMLYSVYKDVAHNLPTSIYYLTEGMLMDRERMSTLDGPQYISEIMEEYDVESVTELPQDKQDEVMKVITSGYGSFTIDW